MHSLRSHPTRAAALAFLALGGVLGAALQVGSTGFASAATVVTVKPAIHGLIDRNGAPDPLTEGFISAYVVKVNWADLQKAPNDPITPDNAIDAAIARVRMPDMAGRVSLKLRVFAGIGAPEWAKEIGGAPLPYVNNRTGSSLTGGTIGRFWLPAYMSAYASFQKKLAMKYDAVPEIRELTVDGCSTLYDELFARQPVPANVATLLGAGYTTAADQQCIKQAIKAHQVWKQTTSDVDFSPLPYVTTTGTDLAFTLSMMDFCRLKLGSRCGLENNSLSSTKLADPTFITMYTKMASLGGTITFQTATSDRIGDWTEALNGAITYHAGSVELPYGYDSWPVSDLATFADEITAAASF